MRESIYFIKLERDNYFIELEAIKNKEDVQLRFISKLNDFIEISLSQKDTKELIAALQGSLYD